MKDTFIYQLFFVPKKGQLLTVIAWIMLLGVGFAILDYVFNWNLL